MDGQLLADAAGAALGIAAQYQLERRAALDHAADARTDALTGLPNRRHAEDLIATLGPGDAVVMVDLDHFGAVNERLGHRGGDDVLAAFGRFLRTELRREDVAARYGGEEFLVVLRGRSLEEATAVVDRLLDRWRRTTPATTFSAGTAVSHGGEVPGSALLRADAALYLAKRSGRDGQRTEAQAVHASAT